MAKARSNPDTEIENIGVPLAVVEEGEVSFDDDAPTKFKDDPTGTVWGDYRVMNYYEADGKTFMLGITSPSGFNGDKVAFVKLAEKTLLWKCQWTACRVGTKPEIPNSVSNNSNWVLLDELPTLSMIGVIGDGTTPIFRISGCYIYGCKNPSLVTFKDLSFPIPPWLDQSIVTDRGVPDSLLQQGISSDNLILLQPLPTP